MAWSEVLKCSGPIGVSGVFSAGRDGPALRQAGCPPLRKIGVCAKVNMNCYFLQSGLRRDMLGSTEKP
jgi:hypothetical protein